MREPVVCWGLPCGSDGLRGRRKVTLLIDAFRAMTSFTFVDASSSVLPMLELWAVAGSAA